MTRIRRGGVGKNKVGYDPSALLSSKPQGVDRPPRELIDIIHGRNFFPSISLLPGHQLA